MKTVVRLVLMVVAVSFVPKAFAQGCPNTTFCVTSVTISPGQIGGDGLQTAVAQVTVSLPPGLNTYDIYIVPAGGANFEACLPPAYLAGSYACYVTGPTSTILLSGTNTTQTPMTAQVKVYADPYQDPGITSSFLVNPIGQAATPPNQPDAPCADCGRGGNPINFTTGDTWITQQDYNIPGLGGGLNLTRTWNSLWPLMLPVQQVGLFGDSWTSNLEERIQALSGGVVQYWKGDGSRLFYLYNKRNRDLYPHCAVR